MLFIMGLVPYVVVGVILASCGVGITHWQFYGIFACMVFSDVISWVKGMSE